MAFETIGLLNMDEAELGRLGEKEVDDNREGGIGERPRELGWLVISIEMLYSSRFLSSAITNGQILVDLVVEDRSLG